MVYPPPSVLIKDFTSSSIDIRILFWIEHFRTWTQIKSDVIVAIDEALKKVGEQNSLPKQGVNTPGSVNEVEKKKDGSDIFPAM
jgi:small-conductance mechanosensitive channel